MTDKNLSPDKKDAAPTPRTDAVATSLPENATRNQVWNAFGNLAQQLERELAACIPSHGTASAEVPVVWKCNSCHTASAGQSAYVALEDYERLARSVLSKGQRSPDMVPLSTISQCPSCDGDGKLTVTPGTFGPCWRCKGSGRVMAYNESKEAFDARMVRLGEFVAACEPSASSSSTEHGGNDG